jgi:CheY-like chemotaxis protein
VTHDVVATANASDGIARLAAEPFDVVIMDVQMPGMDGFQASAAIRALERASGGRVPIVAATAQKLRAALHAGTRRSSDRRRTGSRDRSATSRPGERPTPRRDFLVARASQS